MAVLLFSAPMLFTDSGFGVDFTNHLWTTWVAGKALFQMGHPTYFLHTYEQGVFYPYFAFYGGTMYAITGGLGELLGGHPVVSYLAMTILVTAGAYGGTLWLGRELGLSRWLSHVPALVVVTSAYYVSDLYGRGAWTEFVATSMIPPVLASAVHLTRAPRWRFWPVLVFVISAVIFSGSHNITLLWGTTVCAAGLLILWLVLGRPTQLPRRRLAMIAALGLTCGLVNAWFLVPDISYARDQRTATETPLGPEADPAFKAFIKPIVAFDPPQVLLNPLREVPRESTVPALFVQIPDWFLAWALAAGLLLLWPSTLARGPGRSRTTGNSIQGTARAHPRRDPRSRARTRDADRGTAGSAHRSAAVFDARRRPLLLRAWLGLLVLLIALLVMIMDLSFWDNVPFPFAAIQFPFRLGSYVFYTVSGLVLVGALAMQISSARPALARRVKGLRIALVAVCVISVGLCVWQEWVPNTLYSASYVHRGGAIGSVDKMPRSWYDQGSFNDNSAPEVTVPQGRQLLFDPVLIHGDRFAAWVNLPPGMAPIQTNIAGGPYLVHTSGVTMIGRNEAGYAVVRRTKNGTGPVHVVVEGARSSRIVFGWVVSALAVLTILLVLAWTLWSDLRVRRHAARHAPAQGS